MNIPKFLLYPLGFFVLTTGIVWAGTTTLTTYYPSPSGNYNKLNAQGIGIGTTTIPANGAITMQGIATTAAPTPSAGQGIIYFDSTSDTFQQSLNGSAYSVLGGGPWTTSGNNIYNTNTGNVGIGTTTPNNLLQVANLIDFDPTLNSTWLGYKSGATSTGSGNTGVGYEALYSDTTGWYNAANGYQALYSNTTGIQNTANGAYALKDNTTGNNNTANGGAALYNNTGNNNTANGLEALWHNTTGGNNAANGYGALYNNITGSDNTADGANALYSNTGSDNTALGYNANTLNAGDTNETVIGYNAVGNGNNTITLGNSSITGLYANTTRFWQPSDRRLKENIIPITDALSKVLALQGVYYNFKKAPGKRNIGFIAQDVEKVLPELVDTNNKGFKYVEYNVVGALLVEAIKEQEKEIKDQQKEIQELEKKIGK
jgi:hypothetical protein